MMWYNRNQENEVYRKIVEVYQKNQQYNTVHRIVELHKHIETTSEYNDTGEFEYKALQSIYKYAKRVYIQIRKKIVSNDRKGTVILPECTYESRRIQDLLTFIGVWNCEYSDYLPCGSGTEFGIRRTEILQCLVSRIIHISQKDCYITEIEPVTIIKNDSIQHVITLPYTLDEPRAFNQRSIYIALQVSCSDGYVEKPDVLSYIDQMSGHEFEYWCANLLRKNGYVDVRVTRGSGDQGIDIIAIRDGVLYGIQCKRYSTDVGNIAVQAVYAGKSYYKCNVGVVLTNRYFTPAAKALAEETGIVLWDRECLVRMMSRGEI